MSRWRPFVAFVLALAPAASSSLATYAQGIPAPAPGSTATLDDIHPVVVNRVEKCVAITRGRSVSMLNLGLLEAEINVTKPIGQCGCTSALLTYRVEGKLGGAARQLSSGELNTLRRVGKREQIYFTLASDYTMLGATQKLTLYVGCGKTR